MFTVGSALAQSGSVVIAVDHPGNNARDEMTVPGAILWRDRAEDLGAALERLPRGGHYDFLSTCTEAGRAVVPQCQGLAPQDETHRRAIAAARDFFARALAGRP